MYKYNMFCFLLSITSVSTAYILLLYIKSLGNTIYHLRADALKTVDNDDPVGIQIYEIAFFFKYSLFINVSKM